MSLNKKQHTSERVVQVCTVTFKGPKSLSSAWQVAGVSYGDVKRCLANNILGMVWLRPGHANSNWPWFKPGTGVHASVLWTGLASARLLHVHKWSFPMVSRRFKNIFLPSSHNYSPSPWFFPSMWGISLEPLTHQELNRSCCQRGVFIHSTTTALVSGHSTPQEHAPCQPSARLPSPQRAYLTYWLGDVCRFAVSRASDLNTSLHAFML